MTGRDPETMLRAEARRYPVVAELLSRIADLTDEEIDAAKLPMAWYRPTLKNLRNREQYRASLAEMSQVMEGETGAFRHGVNPSIKGMQAIFRGPEMWVKMFHSEQLLKPGTPVFFPFTGGMWIDSAFSPKADLRTIASYTATPLETNLDAYKSSYNQHLLSQYPDAPMTNNPHAPVSASQSVTGPLDMLGSLGVRFS